MTIASDFFKPMVASPGGTSTRAQGSAPKGRLKREPLPAARPRANSPRPNSPVGTGADGLKLALARLFQHRDEVPDARLVATVHDEILAECPEDAAEATALWLVRHMTGAMQELVGDRVPIIVEATSGRSWAGGDAQ